MKNQSILFIVVVVLCFQTNTFAQQNKFEAGIEGGSGLRFLWGNALVRQYNDPAIGFAYGAAFQYNFPKYFSIRTNLFFERKGCLSKGTYLDNNGNSLGTFRSQLDMDYLTLPILFRAGFGKKVKIFFNAGPYFSYLNKTTLKYKGPNVSGTFVLDLTPNYKRIDIGLAAGIGFSMPLTKILALSFEIRNNLGLYNTSKLPVYGNGSINTNSTNLLIGLAYKFGARSETAK